MNTRSSIERLEDRIAPAAIGAKVSGGTLSITGDPVNDSITITQVVDQIYVLDGMTSLGTFTGVKSIVAKVEGSSSVSAQLEVGIPGGLSVSVGGTSTFSILANSKIGGALSFKGEGSAQTLTLGSNVSVGKSLTFIGGGGADEFTIGMGNSIGGNASFTSVEKGTFSGTNPIEIGGNLTFKNTGTPLSTNIATAFDSVLNVKGKVIYSGGLDKDSFVLGRGTIDGDVSFTDPAGNNYVALASFIVIHGAFKMTTGSGDDQLNFTSGRVDKDVTLKLGAGNNSFYYGIAGGVTIGGNLSYTAGAGNDSWTELSTMTVGKNLTLKLGDGTNTVRAKVNVNGTKVAVTTGSGIDSISLTGSAINAAVVISLGAGADDLVATLLDARSGRYDGGAGLDRFRPNTLGGEPLVVIGFENFS